MVSGMVVVKNTSPVTIPQPSEDTPTVENAARDWNKGIDYLFEFAVKAHYIVGKRDGETARLAKKIKREVDTVERYAAAGFLWIAILDAYPVESELLRDCLDISFWMAVGAKHESGILTILQAKEMLESALDSKWTVEKLRTMLPSSKAGDSPFKRAMRKIYSVIEKDILDAPALESGMNDAEYRRFIRMAKWMLVFLKTKLAAPQTGI